MIKTTYIIRRDLNMSEAKLAIQVGHGTDFVHMRHLLDNSGDYGLRHDQWYDQWINESNRRKSVVGIKTETKLKNLIQTLTNNVIRFNEIWDAGYTEFDGPTMTGIVIHPMDVDHLPKAVTRLRLL